MERSGKHKELFAEQPQLRIIREYRRKGYDIGIMVQSTGLTVRAAQGDNVATLQRAMPLHSRLSSRDLRETIEKAIASL